MGEIMASVGALEQNIPQKFPRVTLQTKAIQMNGAACRCGRSQMQAVACGGGVWSKAGYFMWGNDMISAAIIRKITAEMSTIIQRPS